MAAARDPGARTALDRHCADIGATLAAIRADPHGPVARAVRDDLRRAHPRGVARNAEGVVHLIRALPEPFRHGLLAGSRCRSRWAFDAALNKPLPRAAAVTRQRCFT